MSFAPSADERLRLWNSLGAAVFGNDTGAEVDFHVTSRNGQFAIGTTPVTTASTVVANVGGYGITWPMVLIGAGLAFLVLRK